MSFIDGLNKNHKDNILRTGKSYNEPKIYCPYCAEEQDDIYDWDLTPNDEDIEGQCQKCERHFMYKVRLSFSSRKMK